MPDRRKLLPAFCVMLVWLSAGCAQFKEAGDTTQRFMDFLTGRTARVAAVKMEDPYFADERREGISRLVEREFGKHPPYTERYAQIAANDPDYLVRATAVRALNRARDRQRTALFVQLLGDSSDVVRLEAAKALVNMPDAQAAPALEKIVTNPNEKQDVRIAAADALKHYRNADVARALIAQLGARDFGIAWQARRSLVKITGKDMHYDESAWLNYVRGPDKPLG